MHDMYSKYGRWLFDQMEKQTNKQKRNNFGTWGGTWIDAAAHRPVSLAYCGR